MRMSRRAFLTRLSALAATTPLTGCLGDSDSSTIDATPAPNPNTPPSSSANAQPVTASAPQAEAPPSSSAPLQNAQNSGPVWQASPTIEFVEGVPAVVSVRDFVRDPDSDPLVITLQSGTLVPGLTWNPANATISYDGRPLGAKDTAPVIVSGIVFSADDRR